MNTRVAAVALAASALIAVPAFADAPKALGVAKTDLLGSNASVTIKVGDNHRRYDDRDYRDDRRFRGNNGRGNAYGHRQTRMDVLRGEAVRACRRAVAIEADHIGFRDVDFNNWRDVDQIGRDAFLVHFRDVEFEGRRIELERDVTCTVRHGNVTRVDGVPDRYRSRYRDADRHDRSNRNYRGY